MAVESASTISGLNPLWPDDDDFVIEGDNSIRLIKSVLKSQFTGVTGDLWDVILTVGPRALNAVPADLVLKALRSHFFDNGIESEIKRNGSIVLKTTAAGVDVAGTALNLVTSGAAAIKEWGASGGISLTLESGGNASLQSTDPAGAVQKTFIGMARDGAVTLFFNNIASLLTQVAGIRVRRASGSYTYVDLEDPSGVLNGRIGASGSIMTLEGQTGGSMGFGTSADTWMALSAGGLQMNEKKIQRLAEPTAITDATTKQYVDAAPGLFNLGAIPKAYAYSSEGATIFKQVGCTVVRTAQGRYTITLNTPVANIARVLILASPQIGTDVEQTAAIVNLGMQTTSTIFARIRNAIGTGDEVRWADVPWNFMLWEIPA